MAGLPEGGDCGGQGGGVSGSREPCRQPCSEPCREPCREPCSEPYSEPCREPCREPYGKWLVIEAAYKSCGPACGRRGCESSFSNWRICREPCGGRMFLEGANIPQASKQANGSDRCTAVAIQRDRHEHLHLSSHAARGRSLKCWGLQRQGGGGNPPGSAPNRHTGMKHIPVSRGWHT